MRRRTEFALAVLVATCLFASIALAETKTRLPKVQFMKEDPFKGPDYPGLRKGFLTLEMGDVSIYFSAMLQVQAAFFTQSGALLVNGDPAEQAGFKLRRSRFAIGGYVTHTIAFELELEVIKEAGEANLLAAWIGYERFPYAKFYLGAFKMPFSKSAMTSSAYLQLIERPLSVDMMAPYHQLGFMITGSVWHDRFSYQVGIFNGLARKPTALEGYETGIGASLGNRLSRYVTMVRLDFEPLGKIDPAPADFARNKFLFGMGAGYFFNDGKSIRIHAVSANLQMKAYGFSMLAEFLFDQTEPTRNQNEAITLSARVRRMAAYAQLAYMIITKPLGLELAFRAEWLDDNRSVKDEGDQIVLTGGLNIYFIRNVAKFQINYVHRLELHGQEIKNNTVFAQLSLAF
ncbi:MAG: hypothetical protein KC609_26640 [Myxococcales bacterium]|nr:hypothetical protein [Myxococcales bacterium]